MRLIDLISYTTLCEMAFDRKTAKDKVTDLSSQIFEHLLKLFVFNSPENSAHWITEINGWLWKIDDIKLKTTKQKPSPHDLHNWLILDSAPHYDAKWVTDTVGKLKRRQYKDISVREFDPTFVIDKMIQIMARVCIDISNNSFDDIKDYL